METDRTKLQDTLEGINIHEGTLEELDTDTLKSPDNADSKGVH